MSGAKYKRVMLKLSGELLMGDKEYGVDYEYLEAFSKELIEVTKQGTQLIVEVGGGNIYRWRTAQKGIKRNTADMMGMLGSVMSALNLRDGIEAQGAAAEAMSPIFMPYAINYYRPREADKFMDKGAVVIVGGGTGKQFFTTDSGAAEHALQTDCDVLLKGTDVDGVYDSDPDENPDAKKFSEISFDEVLASKLNVMDMTAFALCRDNKLPIVVFDVTKQENIIKAAKGESIGTVVS